MFANVLLKKQYYFFFIYNTDGEKLIEYFSRQVGFLPYHVDYQRHKTHSNPVMSALK